MIRQKSFGIWPIAAALFLACPYHGHGAENPVTINGSGNVGVGNMYGGTINVTSPIMEKRLVTIATQIKALYEEVKALPGRIESAKAATQPEASARIGPARPASVTTKSARVSGSTKHSPAEQPRDIHRDNEGSAIRARRAPPAKGGPLGNAMLFDKEEFGHWKWLASIKKADANAATRQFQNLRDNFFRLY